MALGGGPLGRGSVWGAPQGRAEGGGGPLPHGGVGQSLSPGAQRAGGGGGGDALRLGGLVPGRSIRGAPVNHRGGVSDRGGVSGESVTGEESVGSQ